MATQMNLLGLIHAHEAKLGKRISVAEIARDTGLDPHTLGSILDGSARGVYLETIGLLKGYFGCDYNGVFISLPDQDPPQGA